MQFLSLHRRTSSTEKHDRTYEIAEVVPSAGIGKSVDTDVCEQAGNKTEQHKKSMKQAREEAGWIVCFWSRLCRAARYNKGNQHNRQEPNNAEASGGSYCSQWFRLLKES